MAEVEDNINYFSNKTLETFNQEERIKGAKACLQALRVIEGVSRTHTNELTSTQYFEDINYLTKKILAATANLSPRDAGVICTLAEYIFSELTAGAPHLDNWMPEAAMTKEEIFEKRKVLSDEWDD
jgi:hypothetical protein